MGFFDSVKRTISQLDFWDRDENAAQRAQFAREEEERKRREQEILARQRAEAAAQRVAREAQANQPTVPSLIDQKRPFLPQVNQSGQAVPGSIPSLTRQELPSKPANQKWAELQQLTEQNKAQIAAQKQAQDLKRNPLARMFTRAGLDSNDEAAARNQAVRQFQDKYGWNADPEVLAFTGQTAKTVADQGQSIRGQGNFLKSAEDNAVKAAEIASYLPITGTIMDWGMRAAPNSNTAMRDYYNRVQLGMTTEEYNSLDPDTRGKIDALMNVGTAAGALDFTGIGGLANASKKVALRQAIKELIEQQGLKSATKTAVIKGSKETAKKVLPATAIGAGLTTAAQGYLGGWDTVADDPLETAKTSLMIGFSSLLDPSQGTRNVTKRMGVGKAVDNAGDVVGDVPTDVPAPAPPKPGEVAPGVIKTEAQIEAERAAAEAAETAAINERYQQEMEAARAAQAQRDAQVAAQRQQAEAEAAETIRRVNEQMRQPDPVNPPQAPVQPMDEALAASQPNTQALTTAQQAVDDAATAPAVTSDVPDTAPVQTPITQASKTVPTIAPVDDSAAVKQGLESALEQLNAERQSLRNAGESTKEIDAEIKAIRTRLKGSEVTVDAEADARVAEATAELKKNVKPTIRSRTELSKGKEVKTRQLTPEEMAERGFAPEVIANIMAKRAESEASTKPAVTKAADEVKAKAEKAEADGYPDVTAKELKKLMKSKRFKQMSPDEQEGIRALFSEKVSQEYTPKPQPEPNRAADLEENAGIDPVTTEPVVKADPDLVPVESTRAKPTKKQRALEVIEGASSEADKIELYKTAKMKGLIETSDIPKKYRKEVLAETTGTNVLPKEAREQAEVEDVLGTLAPEQTPTASLLQEGARQNTTKAGKVSKRWINQQLEDGADPTELRSAIEKVEGRKAPETPEQKLTKEQRAAANKLAKAEREKAKAEGKDMVAAPRLTGEMARQISQDTGDTKVKDATRRAITAHNRKINIEVETAKADAVVDKVSDAKIIDFTKKFLTDTNNLDKPEYLFTADAISRRLDKMRREGKLEYEDMIEALSDVAKSTALNASQAGQTQRIVQEIYKNLPAPVRVKNELNKLQKHYDSLGKEFKPTEADEKELVALMDKFDAATTQLTGAESNMETAMAKMIDPEEKMGKAEIDKLMEEFEGYKASKEESQRAAVDASGAYSDKLDSIRPELTRGEKLKEWALDSPDKAGNYLRASMLSALSGRIRDMFSTTFNVADQFIPLVTSALTGKVINKTVGTNLIDSVGSRASLKKGATGAVDKVRASWRGESTLDEATGRAPTVDRSELGSKDSISIYDARRARPQNQTKLRKALGTPKRLITTAVQIPTDVSYGVYTNRLYANGLKVARENGLTGYQAKKYAEMFMENPTTEAVKDSAQVWLKNSGMHDNFISRTLKKAADGLDKAGSNTNEPVKVRFAKKAAARAFRMTTIPFVQYAGGATHAMLIDQNPLVNIGKGTVAAFKKDPQTAVEELARGGWNAAKITTITGLIAANVIETSDTDADGENRYNGPYVVRDGRYVPASTYGIAAGSAIISAHYLNKAREDLMRGDLAGVAANTTVGPWWATIKASGMDNMLSGSTMLGGLPASVSQVSNNPNKDEKDMAATITGGLIGDFGTQAAPAVLRDIEAFMNHNSNYNPTGEAADTSGKDEYGRVDPIKKGIDKIKAGIPGLADDLPRKSGSQAKGFWDRVFNANTQTEQQAAAIKAKQRDREAAQTRAQSIFNDKNISALLSDENAKIHDKYKGDISNASDQDLKKMWSQIKESKDELIDRGKFGSHATVLQHEYDEMKASGKSTEVDLAKQSRKITRSKLADENKIDPQIFRLYTGDDTAEGGGISQSEFNKMIDPDSDTYDLETASALYALDQLFTKNGVSANSNGMNPWTRPKYKNPKDAAKGKGKGGGKKTIGTNFGTIGSFAKPDNVTIKYQKLGGPAIPNLTQQSSRTNLKKKISVVKGVKL